MHHKYVGKVPVYFILELNILRVLSAATDKNVETEVGRTWSPYPKNCLRTYIDMNLCPSFVVWHSLLKIFPVF